MQQILIGNPLQLTEKGLLALHKLKYDNTYFYKHTWDNFGVIDDIQLITEKEFIEATPSFATNYYLLPVDLGSCETEEFLERFDTADLPSNNNATPHEFIWFCADWAYPKEEFRTDNDLISLFNEDTRREYFNYDSRPRLIIIPKNIEWYIRQDKLDREYIQEKSRSWN